MIDKEVYSLWEPVADKVFGDAHIASFALDYLLGVNEYYEYVGRPHSEDTPMPAELKSKLQKLASPHWRTVLAVNGITQDIINFCMAEGTKARLRYLEGPMRVS